MKPLVFILTLTVFFLSCKKENIADQTVEIYLLKSYQTVQGKCQIDGSTSVLQDTPIGASVSLVPLQSKDF